VSAAIAVDPAVRDQLVMTHVDLVKAMASRLRRRLPSQVEVSELVSVGVLGLIDAATRYQPTLGVPFDAFARRRIQGAMLDALRGLDWVPRSVRRCSARARKSRRACVSRSPRTRRGRDRGGMGMSIDDYTHLLDEIRTIEVAVARPAQADGEPTSLIDLVIDSGSGQQVQLERAELRSICPAHFRQLPERERQVLSLSYVQDLTLAEIGKVFGVSESRVSQIRTQAILRLRSLLRPRAGPEGDPLMASLITPEELEAIRAAGPSGPRPPAAYDFRRPDRISKEQMHALQFLHERCARNMSTSFSAYLRTTVTLSVASVDQLAYDEFLRSVADPTAFYALGIAPFDELGALEINPADRVCADRPHARRHGEPASVNRPLSEIEQNVVDSVVKLLLEGIAEAWKPVTNLAFSIRARETRPQMLQVAAPTEGFVVVVFQMQVSNVGGTVTLCIPASVVETASAQFTQAWPKQRREASPQDRAWIAEHIARTGVPVEPMIRATLPASTVLSLEPGSVLALPLAADRPWTCLSAVSER
jgi:flagellar motor switch protein FliM